jgi:hypothetical protein
MASGLGIAASFIEGGEKGMKSMGRTSVEVDGQRVPLTPEGIAGMGDNAGEKIAAAFRAEVERAVDG